jgi:hypothetical protein
MPGCFEYWRRNQAIYLLGRGFGPKQTSIRMREFAFISAASKPNPEFT